MNPKWAFRLSVLRSWGFLLLPVILAILTFTYPPATPIVAITLVLLWPLERSHPPSSYAYLEAGYELDIVTGKCV